MIEFAWLVPVLPLLGSLVVALAGRRLGRHAHWPVVVGIGLAFVTSLFLLPIGQGHPTKVLYRWIEAGTLAIPIEFQLDGLTTLMLSMVTFVATLVAIFAVGYMAGDPAYPRFFAVVGLFVFSMTGLVLSNNYVLTYAFWEGVGVCSYLLVGFWHSKPAAAAAAKKAFLVNRIGDLGFAVALFWMWVASNEVGVSPLAMLSYDHILSAENLGYMSANARQGVSLLLFWAATAKSAQILLYVWLPDAMEGPTPVSALIHAATMVTAGVYLIARSATLVFSDPLVPALICLVGCATALLSAAIALTQTDLKRVLAYSTISQLGYMFMGLGSGVGDVMQLAVVAGMFHLFTHAFFKALLFLASGSVMHAMGGVIDMRRFRGLRHRLPITCLTFAAGGLALSGIPPFAGFWSKDEVLLAIKEAAHAAEGLGWSGLYQLIYWVAVITAMLTAFYTGRAFFMTFFGPEKLPSPDDPEAREGASSHTTVHGHDASHDHDHGGHEIGHESPPIMWVPLAVLAAFAVVVGMVFGPTHLFEHHVEHSLGFERLGHPEHGHGFDWATASIGTMVGLIGLAASAWLYARPNPVPARIARRLGRVYRASRDKFYVDEIYDTVIVTPLKGLASIASVFDRVFVDGLVRFVAWAPRFVGREVLGPLQNGLVQFYAAATALGVAFLLIVILLWS